MTDLINPNFFAICTDFTINNMSIIDTISLMGVLGFNVQASRSGIINDLTILRANWIKTTYNKVISISKLDPDILWPGIENIKNKNEIRAVGCIIKSPVL